MAPPAASARLITRGPVTVTGDAVSLAARLAMTALDHLTTAGPRGYVRPADIGLLFTADSTACHGTPPRIRREALAILQAAGCSASEIDRVFGINGAARAYGLGPALR